MNPANDRVWIQKSICIRAVSIEKFEALESFCSPTCRRTIPSEPSDEQEVHPNWFRIPPRVVLTVFHIDMKDADDAGVPVWVSLLVFVGEYHYVGTGARIDGVLFAS